MNNKRKLLMLTFLAFASASLNAQSGPIAIDLRPLQSEPGSAKKVELTLRSRQLVKFPCSDVSRIRIYVYKPDGSLAQDTAEGSKLKEEQSTPQSHSSVCVSNTMKPGQSVKQDIDVGNLYEMDASGTYRVKAELDLPDGSTARSSLISIQVR